ncbi:MAG: hypothetical protein OJF58_000133 [Enhydrobacter sp.]|nr:MAG: hypothetical protein OJF58_000133 [Enhydrobacter sp.]
MAAFRDTCGTVHRVMNSMIFPQSALRRTRYGTHGTTRLDCAEIGYN